MMYVVIFAILLSHTIATPPESHVVDAAEKKCNQTECVNKCLMDELKVLDDQNVFHIEVFPERYQEKAKACYEKFKDLPAGCEQASKIGECFETTGVGIRS